METLQEQIEYGSRCKPHGTPLGTPGGADLMCGLCESGLTEWVDDPCYGLSFTYGLREEWVTEDAGRKSTTRWWESDLDAGWEAIERSVRRMNEAVEDAIREGGITLEDAREFFDNQHWQAVRINDGYWIDPRNEGMVAQ